MNKTAQNLTWNCLPLEVRNEVKRQYQIATNAKEYYTECTLEYLFGIHNLTSDADGEELLTCKRDQAVKLYDIADKAYAISGDKWYQGYMKAMIDLFGSKCLPDEEPKPSEPFKVGGKVKVCKIGNVYNGAIGEIIDVSNYGTCYVLFPHNQAWFRFADLEPYTEPTDLNKPTSTCTDDCSSQYRNLSQENANCDKQFDNILKDGSKEHNRLHIAAMMAQAILTRIDDTPQVITEVAFRYADALIAESEKGGKS